MNSWAAHLASRIPKPELPGAELEPFPFISGFGIAWRVCRLSCLENKELFTALGIRKSTNLSFLQACHQPGATRTRFIARCGLSNTTIPDYWDTQTWSPLDLHGYWQAGDLPIRHCQECARFGYHCTLFQLPSITQCPWHRLPLRSMCRRCGKPYSPYLSGEELGQCVCGFDLFNANQAATSMWKFPHKTAEALLLEYLRWAQNERTRRHFVAPPDCRTGILGFSQLAAPPMHWNGSREKNHVTNLKRYRSDSNDPLYSAFAIWSMWADRPPHTLCGLPFHTYRRLKGVLATFSKSSDPEAKFIKPLVSTGADSAWLNISSIDPKAVHACSSLFLAVSEQLGEPETYKAAGRPTDRRADALNGLKGRWRLDKALADLITRGLVQGLEAFFHREFQRPRQLSRWLSPVIEIEGVQGHLIDIQICWVPEPPQNAQPCVNSLRKRKCIRDRSGMRWRSSNTGTKRTTAHN